MKSKLSSLFILLVIFVIGKSSEAHDVLGYSFYNKKLSDLNAPFLTVDLMSPEADAQDVSNKICQALGFHQVSEFEIDEVSISSPDKVVVDFNFNGLKPFPVRAITSKDSVTLLSLQKVKIFTKLICLDDRSASSVVTQPCDSASAHPLGQSFEPIVEEVSKSVAALLDEESTILEGTRQSPEALLKEMYEQSNILFLGKPSHESFETYVYLEQLLEQVKDDPNLKYLVLERSFIAEEFLKAASTNEITPEMYYHYLPTPAHQAAIHPRGESGRLTDPYILSVLIPFINKLNQSRLDNPIIILPIDSFDYRAESPLFLFAVDNPSAYRPDQLHPAMTWSREDGTRRNFEQKVLGKLGANDKAIVVYHAFHLIQGLEGRLPRLDSVKGVYKSSQWHPFSWGEMLFKIHPDLRKQSKIVLFDEEGPNEEKGTFVFSQRHKHYGPFGTILAPFSEKLPEKGLFLFNSDHLIRDSQQPFHGLVRSGADISEVADAIIFTPDTKFNTRNKLPQIKEKINLIFGY